MVKPGVGMCPNPGKSLCIKLSRVPWVFPHLLYKPVNIC